MHFWFGRFDSSFTSIFFGTLFICLSFPLLAQSPQDTSRSDYALLWEISGNELEAPSYVFGSMHVRYKSVFEFPDSLLICLQACDAVANEVHLDSAMLRILELYVGNEEVNADSAYIQFIQEKILLPDTSKVTSKPDSTTLDFRRLLKGLSDGEDLRNSGFMPTMLDAYLMEVGRRFGKTHYGLEEIDNHLYENEESTLSGKQMNFSWFGHNPDELLRLYYAGDLGPIATFIERDPRAFNQLALIARNYIMVKRMQEVMPRESLFSIVGAAHLPGEEGVIELLKKAGYTLRRVTPTFNGLANSTLIPEIERPWPVKNDANSLFSFGMPIDFLYQSSEGASTSYLSFDIGRGASYLILTSSLLPLDYDDFDDAFFVQDGYEIDEKTPINHNGLEGFRYDMTKPSDELEFYRGYTFNYDQTLYYLQVGAYQQETLETLTDVDTFLSKFKLLKESNNKWVTVKDTLGGFQLRLPGHYAYSSSLVNEGYPYEKENDYPIHLYRAGFEEPAASVWCQYYDYLPGKQQENEATQLQEGLEYLEGLYGIDIQVTSRDSLQGFPRWKLEGEFADKGLLFSGQLITRANRIYLLSQVDLAKSKTTKKFQSSFRLLPLVGRSSNPVELVKDVLSVSLPIEATPAIIDLRSDDAQMAKIQYQVEGVDPGTSATYLVDVFLYPSLISIKDSVSFIEQEIAPLVSSNDELTKDTTTYLASGQFAHEKYYRTGHAQLQKKIQYYHQGRYWVRKQMVAPQTELNGENAALFFQDDNWQPSSSSFKLFSPRTEVLCAGLQTQDSIRLREGLKVLDAELALDQDDLPLLRNVFLDNYWHKYELAQQITDKLIPAFLREGEYGQQVLQQICQYDRLSEVLRLAIVSALATADQPEAYQLLFRLLEQGDQSSPALAETALAPFDQNPALVMNYWPSFVKLLTNEQEPLFLWELARQVLVQDSVDKALIHGSQQLFVNRGIQRLASWTPAHGNEIPKAVFGLYRMLPFKDEVLNMATSYYERSTVDWASLEAAAYLFENGEVTSKRKWKQMLKDEHLKVPFLRLLNEFDLLQDISGKYYDEETIARYLFMEKVSPTGEVSRLELLDVVETLFRGEPRRAYVFSFDIDGDENHLAVVGFFARDPKDRAFLDDGLVNYTLYTISPRRRANKAEQLIEELEDISIANGVYEEDDPTHTPFK